MNPLRERLAVADTAAERDGGQRQDVEAKAWALPAHASCAGLARTLVDEAFGALGVAREVIGEAKVMASELATNALQHAGAHGPHELWIDRRENEVICAIFDGLPLAEFSGDLTFSGDCGRGLAIVAELSAGRWGVQTTQSRLRFGVTGKVVWFACTIAARAVPSAASRTSMAAPPAAPPAVQASAGPVRTEPPPFHLQHA